MRRHLLYFTLVALAVVATGASSTLAARNASISYVFNGELLADAGSSSTLYVDVKGGNHAALRKLLGQKDEQNFAVDASTEYLRWSHGVPSVVAESNLVAGDFVSVNVRADRGASLDAIESSAARIVSDRGPSPRFAHKPLWLFVGNLDAPASSSKLTLHIQSGNWLALHAMLGQALDQTFKYDRNTIFVLWQGRVPIVISPSQLKVGDRISVRIRAPRNDSLAQAEQVPANHVAEHEPAPPTG
jgi:hypothetical protein